MENCILNDLVKKNTHSMAPLGDISIGIKCAPGVVGPAEADIDFDIIKNDNDTFTVKYTPPGAGKYTIMVLFADQVRIKFPVALALIDCILLVVTWLIFI